MKKSNKAIIIIAKIAEVANLVMALTMLILGITAICAKTGWIDVLSELNEEPITELSTAGFSISILNPNGQISIGSLILFSIAGIVSSLAMTMIFRNIYLIFKTSEGLTKFSTGKTPFQKDNIRMVREIGIFSISIPVFQLVISILAKIILGVDNVETSVEFTGFVFGLVAICLSSFFAYGMELEADVEGLV